MSQLDRVVQKLIPPTLIALLTVTIYDWFFGQIAWIGYFDAFVITIFAIDLWYRYQESSSFIDWARVYWLDIIATIPFNLIFTSLVWFRAFRGVRILRVALRSVRILRLVGRAPRFLRLRKQVKPTVIRKVQPHEKEMKKTLPFYVVLLITINSIMGTGIYFLTSAGAKHAGPASLISWFVLSCISIYIAACFSELTAMFPKAGGVYEFAKQAYGRFWSFAVGWMTAIGGNVTIAMLLLGALQYAIPQYPQYYIGIAIALILLFNYIAFKGMQTSVMVLVSFAVVTLGTMAALIIPGLTKIDPNNYVPFFVFPSFSILLTIFFIAETFFGWESAVFLSAETKNPKEVMPKALIGGTFVIAGIALLLSFVSMGIIPWSSFGDSVAPLADLGGAIFGPTGQFIFTILVFTSIIGAVACWVVTSPRLLMSVAEDKLFFVQFAKLHPHHKSPYVSIAFQVITLIILVIIGAGSYETLLHMLVPIILAIYSAVLMAVTILRVKKPNHPRPFKVPFGNIGPVFTVLFMMFLLSMFIMETHHAWEILRISIGLVMFGVPAYFFIELFYETEYVELRRSMFARLRHYLHMVPKPRTAYNRIIRYTGPYNKNTVIVDSNSPMGVISHLIHKKKHPYKKHHIFCSSKEEKRLLERYVAKRSDITDVHNVRIGQLPRSLKTCNVFISHNDLGHVKSVSKYLAKVANLLPRKAKFCFYVTHHALDIAQNANLIEDKDTLLQLFKDVGLNAQYKKRNKGYIQEIFVYGEK